MDYIVEREEIKILFEKEKICVKNHIIQQYIDLRKKKGISQEVVANRTGIARTNIIRIENGKNVPTIEVLTKLALALDMKLEINFVEN